jgi:hypothetical protein
MQNVVDALRWVSAVVGVALLLTGLVVVIGRKGSGAITRAFGGPQNAGWFSVKFGLALILFNVAGGLQHYHWWAIGTTVAAVVFLASSLQNRPFQATT